MNEKAARGTGGASTHLKKKKAQTAAIWARTKKKRRKP